MTAALRAALVERLLAEGLGVDDAIAAAKTHMAWIERGDMPLALPAPAKAAAKEKDSPPRHQGTKALSKPAAPNGAAAKPGRRLWTAEDTATLRELCPQLDARAIAARLGRPLTSIYSRAAYLNLGKSGARAKAANVSDAPAPRRAAEDALVKFLRARGYGVTALELGRYRVDQKTLDRAGLVALANRVARGCGKPEFAGGA